MNRTYQMLMYFLTIVVGQGIGFVLLPVITRFLPPEQYGEYALALTLTGLAGTLGSSWVRNVSLRLYFDAKKVGRTRAFYWTTAMFQAGLLSVLYVLMALGFHIFSENLLSGPVLLVAGLQILVGDFFSHTVQFLRAEERSGQYAAAEIGSGVVRLAATLAGFLLGFRSPVLLFLAAALALGLAGLYAAVVLDRRLSGPLFLDWPVARSLLRFGPPALPFSIGSWFELMVDRVVLAFYFGTSVVGIYNAGYALADKLLGGVVSAIFMMSWPDILNAWTTGGLQRARDAVSHGFRLYFWLTLGPVVFISLFSGLLTELLAPEYAGAASIIPVVVLATWLSGFKTYLNRHFELNKQYSAFSAITLLGAAVNLGLNLVLVPRLGMIGAAFATLANYLVTCIVFFVLRDRQLTTIPYKDFLGALTLAGIAWLASSVAAEVIARAVIFVASYVLGLGLLLVMAKPYRHLLISGNRLEGD